MTFVRKILIAITLIVTTGSGIAFAAIPGPHRLLIAGFYGFENIGSQIYAPAGFTPAKRFQMLQNLKAADKEVADFFGEMRSSPRIFLCPSRSCDKMLGAKGPRGVAYGHSVIVLRQKGLNKTIATHERVHIELHKRLGLIGLGTGRLPGWFDEGLATLLSKDKRMPLDATEADIAWIKGAQTIWDWKHFATQTEWRRAYNAAATAVQQIELKIGRAGLRKLIKKVTEDGMEYEKALAEAG